MRGELAYKDINGSVWHLTEIEDEVMAYAVGVPDGFREDTIENVIDEIDRREPEWVKQPPSEPVQIEQADTGAFPELKIELGEN